MIEHLPGPAYRIGGDLLIGQSQDAIPKHASPMGMEQVLGPEMCGNIRQ